MSLLQRLKERKLVQWGLAYLAGAFFVYTGLDPARETWGIPETVIRGVHILLIAGFLITLVLAWYHGEKGRQRVSGPELLMVAALLVVAGVALAVLRTGRDVSDPVEPGTAVAQRGDRPGVAVLPLDNFSPDPNDAYFADGVHEEIISKLSRVSGLRVISRNSVMRYREERKLTREVAGELGVRFIVEGSARIGGGAVRLTLQLIDGLTDEHLWAEDYDRPYTLEGYIPIQSEIAQEIAEALQVRIAPEEQARFAALPTQNLRAYEAYQRGRYFLHRLGAEDARRAIGYFRTAIELDPAYSSAYVGLSEAYRVYQWYSPLVDPLPVQDSARVALEVALELDSLNAGAYGSLALFRLVRDWDLEGAEAALARALALDPEDSDILQDHAYFLAMTGDLESALPQQRRALAADPFNAAVRGDLGLYLKYLGRGEEAIAEYEASLEIDPLNPIVRCNLGWAYLGEDRVDEALAEFQRLEIWNTEVAGGLTHAFVSRGERDRALQVYEDLLALASRQRVSKVDLALALRPLNESGALDLLGQAVEERDPSLLGGMRWFFWSELNQTRYREILNSMGLDLEGERLVVFEGGS
jgi:TolB-like protein/Flp pilus assembly protein TadD